MPSLNNEGLDDPLVFDAMPDFSGGQASNRPASALEQAQYFRGINVDIKTKLAVTRRGTSTLGAPIASRIQGLQWFSTPTLANNYLIGIAGGELYKYDEVAWSALTATYLAPVDTQIATAQLIDKIYLAEQTTNLHSWDGTTLADLGSGLATEPPQGSLILSHTNRLWLAGNVDVPDQLTASGLLAASWDTADLSIRIGGGEGDPITGLAPLDSYQVVVFKRNSIYIVTADPSTTATDLSLATVTRISDVIGCVSARSIAVVGSDVWFLSDSGVRSLRRVIAQNDREVSQAISEPVQDIIERINWPTATKCAATFWDNKYMLSLPLDGAEEPETVLVFDTLRQAWSGYWVGWTPIAWALSKANGNERLNFGLPSGDVWRWLDYITADSENDSSFQDAGANISSEIVSRGFVYGDAFSDKSLFAVEATFYQSVTPCNSTVAFEQGEEMEVATQFETQGGTPLLLPFTLPAVLGSNQIKRRKWPGRQFNRFREMQVIIRATQGKMALRAITACAFPETVRPQQ